MIFPVSMGLRGFIPGFSSVDLRVFPGEWYPWAPPSWVEVVEIPQSVPDPDPSPRILPRSLRNDPPHTHRALPPGIYSPPDPWICHSLLRLTVPGVAADPRDVFSRQFFPPFPWQCYRDLALVSRDGMNIVLNKINHILMEKYLKLQDTCRTQVRDPLLGAPVPSWDLLGWEWDPGGIRGGI